MFTASTPTPARAAGVFRLGGEVPIHRLGFGAMRITGRGVWGPPADPAEARRVLTRAVELGIDFIDTADSYGPFVSEDLITEALYPYPDDLVIATKGGFLRTGPGQWTEHGHPAYLRQAVQLSRRRLKLDTIPLYQLHRIDPHVPRADQFAVMKAFVDEGLVRFVGLSEVGVEEIEAAREVLPIATVQNRYSVGFREHEDVVDYCEREGIGFIPWYPLDAGKLAKNDLLDDAAEALGATKSQVALAWLLKRSPVMLPIPGTSSVEHLEENTHAAALDLPDDLFEALSEAATDAA